MPQLDLGIIFFELSINSFFFLVLYMFKSKKIFLLLRIYNIKIKILDIEQYYKLINFNQISMFKLKLISLWFLNSIKLILSKGIYVFLVNVVSYVYHNSLLKTGCKFFVKEVMFLSLLKILFLKNLIYHEIFVKIKIMKQIIKNDKIL